MPRPITINNCVTGHQIGSVHKFSRGMSWDGRTTQYGTKMRCECGRMLRSNEGPPSKTKKWQNDAYRAHVVELGPPVPEVADPRVRMVLYADPADIKIMMAYVDPFPYPGAYKSIERAQNALRDAMPKQESAEFQTPRGH